MMMMMMNLTNGNGEIEPPLVIQLNKPCEKSILDDPDFRRSFCCTVHSVYHGHYANAPKLSN